MKCSIGDCDNQAFEDLNKCALHCEKECIHENSRNTILSEFNRFFKLYIIDKALSVSGKDLDEESYRNEIVEYRKNNKPLHQSKIFREKFCEYEIGVHEILFPNTSLVNYTETLMIFRNIWFDKCVFYIKYFNLKSTGVFFEQCVFKCEIYIEPAALFLLKKNSIFYQCVFEDEVYIGREGRYKYTFGESLFSGCVFENFIKFKNAIFKKEPFLDIGEREIKISTLEIRDCNFDGGFKLNSMRISYLWIENTSFLIGFWILKANISTLNCINVTVDGLFDASDSSFIRAKFNRTRFLDVADFEGVRFGEVNGKYLKSDQYVTIFKYVTFMTASNFKNTSFFYSLDFENVDLREQPNFLKSYVNSYNTNRETFRIIKHSFDSKGNNLEGNRFFVEEMKAYKRELNNEDSKWEKLIFFANDIISDFGRSYIRPIAWLVVSLILYTILLNAHASYFKKYQYFLHPYFDTFSVYANSAASNFLPFSRFLESKSGFELISLFFYIWFGILIWQIVVAVKRHTQR